MADAYEEDEVGDEEADTEVQVNGGASVLDGTDKPEGQYADEEAYQRQRESDPCDELKLKHVLLHGLENERH